MGNFRYSPLSKAKAINSQFYREYESKISLDKTFRTKRICMKEIFSDEEKQYAKLWRYAATIRESNDRMIVKVGLG